MDIKYPHPVSSMFRALLTDIEFHERRGIRTILKYLTTDAHEKAKKKDLDRENAYEMKTDFHRPR